MINKIALTVVHNKTLLNPLRVLKKGTQPLGSDIEEIFTNMAQAETYDPSGQNLLKVTKPDVKVIYHRLNRRDVYPVTIYDDELKLAFTNWGKMGELITSIINSLYSGDNKDEYILSKKLIGSVIENEYAKIVEVDFEDADDSKELAKAIQKFSGYMKYPKSDFNSYIKKVLEDNPNSTEKPVITWTPTEDQILLIRSDVLVDINFDVLANVFQLEKAELKNMILEVDDFGEGGENCLAMLCDRSAFEIRDNKYETKSFYNGNGLYWNYWLHHWQTYSFSSFANAIAFCTPKSNTETGRTWSNAFPAG